MRLAPDKIAHFKAGALVAAAALLAAMPLVAQGIHPLSAAVAVAGVGAAAAVEYTQRDSNARLREQGKPPLHDVSWRDALASSVAPLVLAAFVQWAHGRGLL